MPPPGANLIRADSLDDPRLAPYRAPREQWLRARHRHWMEGRDPPADATATGLDPAADPRGDLFLAEGDKVCDQLFSSPHETVSVLIAEHRLGAHEAVLARAPAGTPVFVADKAQVDRLAGYPIHRGLIALGRRTPEAPAADLLARSAAAVICEDLANHDNVGSIFRSVRALAPARDGFEHACCVLLSPRCCDPFYRKALRVSMGNALHVPWATLEPWPDALSVVARAGFGLIGLDPAPGADAVGPSRRPALILGTEGDGLSAACREHIQKIGGRLGSIPIDPAADSLNVAVACAVALDRVRSPANPPGPRGEQ